MLVEAHRSVWLPGVTPYLSARVQALPLTGSHGPPAVYVPFCAAEPGEWSCVTS